MTYFGIEITVPCWVEYIAADFNGELWGYQCKPLRTSLRNGGWWVYDNDVEEGVYRLEIGKVEFEDNERWEDSLVSLNSEAAQ
ncbi:hypothetical protein [Photorhabdus sp. RM323S]|uniref:hypothetical protein n=1 Tax=Photorhabdus sp. RM323S TaxID=3342828 RepID=UPI0036DE303F